MTSTQQNIAQQLADAFAAQADNLWLPDVQRKAMENFLVADFPTSKLEAWKYTNIAQILKNAQIQANGEAAHVNLQSIIDDNRLEETDFVLLVNGVFQPEFSVLPANIVVSPLQLADKAIIDQYYNELTDKEEAFTALNTAFANDGLFIHLPKGVSGQKPLQILHLSTVDKGIANTRYLVIAARESRFEVIESRISAGNNQNLNNVVSEIYVAENAHFTWTTLQQESDEAIQVNNLYSHQSEHSELDTFTAVLGGKAVRNNLNYLPDGEFCQTHLNGVVVGKGDTLADNHTFVNHAQPNCESNESFKHILGDKSTGVFNGKIYVAQDSQKTNAYQSNKTILLGGDAKVFAKPELEIYADDVKCSHGAACGQLDEDAMFYLMARGIEEEAAQKLLLTAFATDVLELIHNENIQAFVTTQIMKRLG
jgi:Fe-S cluster assembly protein SufD